MSIVAQCIGKIINLDGKAYRLVKANNNDANCLSLRSEGTGLFLRHKMGRLVETDASDNADFFPADSSFIPEERSDGFVLRCANKGMEDSYICKIDIDTYIVNPDLVEYMFKALPAPAAPLESMPSAFNPGVKAAGEAFWGRSLNLNGRTYVTVPANDDDAGHLSLLNMANGLYARHFDNKIVESGPDMNPQFFAADSSFKPEAKDKGIILRCVNQGMETRAIVKGEDEKAEALIGDVASALVFPTGGAGWPWELLKTLAANTARMAFLMENAAQAASTAQPDNEEKK